MEVYCIKIDQDMSNQEMDCLRSYVSEETNIRIDKFRFKADKLRTLCGELLVRYALSKRRNISIHSITITRDEFNKPYILDQPVHFNVSHSGKYVVCAIDDEKVGIDVEQTGRIDLKIAKRFFSKAEFDYLMEVDESQKQQVFFELWTMKESYIKFIGRGLAIALDSFSVDLSTNQKKIEGEEIAYVKQYEIKGYQCAVSSNSNKFPNEMEYVSTEEMSIYFNTNTQ